MDEYIFGRTKTKPTRANAKKMDRICKEEGGLAFREVNITEDDSPGVNNGCYEGWFAGPNYGSPHDQNLATRVINRINSECQ